jgi:5'(3')-deoxyribonucleotidase
MKRILVDIDGIVADTIPYWLEYLSQKTGVVATVADIKRYEFAQCPPLNQLPPETVYGVLQDPGFTLGVPLMEGADKVLKGWMQLGHEVYLVTARSGSQHIAETFQWVQNKLPFIDTRKQLIFCYDKHLLSADVIIDDRPITLATYKKVHPTAEIISIEYPYNTSLCSWDSENPVKFVDYGPNAWMELDRVLHSSFLKSKIKEP